MQQNWSLGFDIWGLGAGLDLIRDKQCQCKYWKTRWFVFSESIGALAPCTPQHWRHWNTNFYSYSRHLYIGKRRCPSIFSALVYTVSGNHRVSFRWTVYWNCSSLNDLILHIWIWTSSWHQGRSQGFAKGEGERWKLA